MSVQKFALKDAHVLTNAAHDMFCAKGDPEASGFRQGCVNHWCAYSHDYVLQRKLREIALRLAQRGYGPPKKQEARV